MSDDAIRAAAERLYESASAWLRESYDALDPYDRDEELANHWRDQKAVARAYLDALAAGPAFDAEAFVRECMEAGYRGRKNLHRAYHEGGEYTGDDYKAVITAFAARLAPHLRPAGPTG